MKTFRLIAGAVAVALMSGCTTGPDYKKPEVPLPEKWSESLEGGEQAATPADDCQWWTGFSDPVLDSLVSRAVESNHDLRIAAARVREARAAERETEASLRPQLNTSASYQRNRTQATPGIAMPASDLFQAGFDASWELDLFGGVRRAKEASIAAREAAEENQRDTLITLVAEVARNYFELRSAQNRLDIANRNIRVQKDSLELVRSRFQAGLTNELDVKTAEAQLAISQSSVPGLETSAKWSIHRLGVLLGSTPGALQDELSPTAPLPAAPPEVPVGLPSELLRRRPDVRRAERDVAAATARIGIATSDLFPKFSLTGSFGHQSDTFGGLRLGASQFWSIGPGVRWPILDGGRIRANIRVQNARQEQVLAAYEKTVMTSLEDVENALVAYAKEQTRRASLSQAVDANRQALDIAKDLYTQGLVNFLNVLDAERSLFAAEEQLLQSKATVLMDLVSLYKALGGGWEGTDRFGKRTASAELSADEANTNGSGTHDDRVEH